MKSQKKKKKDMKSLCIEELTGQLIIPICRPWQLPPRCVPGENEI